MGVRDGLIQREEPEAGVRAAAGSAPVGPDAAGLDAPHRSTPAGDSAGLSAANSADGSPDGSPDGSADGSSADSASSAERPQGRSPEETRTRSEARADLRQLCEGDWERRPFAAPRAELGRFDTERAALPAMSLEEAARYVEKHQAARPWLAKADKATPEARRIIAAVDAANGHPQIRHEGWVTEEANMRRVAYLEDPAQLDPEKRSQRIDGLKQNDKRHRCAGIATRITDPDAFATAFARGVEHPKVREALDMAFDSGRRPNEVTVPIADLLGPDGHRYCTGWQLQPVDGSMDVARANRTAWTVARAETGNQEAEASNQEIPEPQASPVPTFKGGVITFVFVADQINRRYEIVSMYADPPMTTGTEEPDASALLGTSSGRPVRDAHRGRDKLPSPGKLRS